MSASRGLVELWREPSYLPFLYLTRTLTTPVPRPRIRRSQQLHLSMRCSLSTSTQDELEPEAKQRHTNPRSITSSSALPTSTTVRHSSATGAGIPNGGSSSDGTEEVINIFSSVISSMGEISQSWNRDKTQQPSDLSPQLEPGSLHGIGDKLRMFQSTDIDPSSPDEEKFGGVDLSVAAFAIAQKETRRICKDVDDAVASGSGDLGIWRICENEIFPMLKQAGLDDMTPTNSTMDSSIAETTQNTYPCPEKVRYSDHKILNVHPDVPIVAVVKHVYPATLLHALRVLQNKFPMSPIATRLFESIRAHGRASLIMGSSKELFHELIDFRWRVYNDLPFIVTLLKEMEENGIDFDKRTLELVDKIRQRGEQELLKSRQAEGRGRCHTTKGRIKRTGGATRNGSIWWNSPVIQKAFRELTSCAKGMDAQIRDVKEHEDMAELIWNQRHPGPTFQRKRPSAC